jgi:hypothetical protein
LYSDSTQAGNKRGTDTETGREKYMKTERQRRERDEARLYGMSAPEAWYRLGVGSKAY